MNPFVVQLTTIGASFPGLPKQQNILIFFLVSNIHKQKDILYHYWPEKKSKNKRVEIS